ncbi:MAG: hypothetical protein NWP83_09525 [Spirosomaceae bacterium]|nr:hypothetical protein [Spirosomataceae bacterium]
MQAGVRVGKSDYLTANVGIIFGMSGRIREFNDDLTLKRIVRYPLFFPSMNIQIPF